MLVCNDMNERVATRVAVIRIHSRLCVYAVAVGDAGEAVAGSTYLGVHLVSSAYRSCIVGRQVPSVAPRLFGGLELIITSENGAKRCGGYGGASSGSWGEFGGLHREKGREG